MKNIRFLRSLAWPLRLGLFTAVLVSGLGVVWANVTEFDLVSTLRQPALHQHAIVHANQIELRNMVSNGKPEKAFEEAFELGDELFETAFNALDGVGANVGQGQRFTSVPRADLNDIGEWGKHTPKRATGPNAQACNECHNLPANDGAGGVASNNIRDPLHTGNLQSFIKRQPPHLFAIGAVQRLAEEMTGELHAIRARAIAKAMEENGESKTAKLETKGVNFGSITAFNDGSIDTSNVKGIDEDLVVRPFDWKGVFFSVRDFNRGAAHNELGMQPVEIVGDLVDGDSDGVVDEMTIGDLTALAIYNAAQPRPTTRIELASLGLIDPLPPQEVKAIKGGEKLFVKAGCAICHIPSHKIDKPTFSEPSQNPNHRDIVFPAGQDPISRGLDPAFPISFDLTQDQPDNQITDESGDVIYRLGALETDWWGRANVRLFGDLKRHDMGPGLAEPIDADGIPAAVFLTEGLWGVGSTAPYLHDGRATTLTEAILAHGGEAANSRDEFMGLSTSNQEYVITFLNNLVLFKLPEE